MTSTSWQLDLRSAHSYQAVLVPAILGPFARTLLSLLAPRVGETVVDVGCGTGAAARCAATRVGPAGKVIGVDPNPAMLEVARTLAPAGGAPVEWQAAPAEALPLRDGSVDVVVCAQTLQFVADREGALREMRRVARPGARVGIAVWRALDENPYFAALAAGLAEHLGDDAARGLRAAFSLSDERAIVDVLAAAGLGAPSLSVEERELALPPLADFVPRHLAATPAARLFEDAPHPARARLVAEVGARLARFARRDGVRLPFRSWQIFVSS